MSSVIGSRLSAMREELGFSQASLASALKLSQGTIAKLESDKIRNSAHLHKIARILGTTSEYLTGETDDPTLGATMVISQEQVIEELNLRPVREIDLGFGMGGTFLDVPVTENIHYFSDDFIKRYTKSPAKYLFFAEGIGDSMNPTIQDQDLLLIDGQQKQVTIVDKIWACAFSEIGMVKRLRPASDGAITILSDNASVSEMTAHDGELHILGRVVGIVRKV